MPIGTKTNVWLWVTAAAAAIGCGSQAPGSPVAWNCASVAVPNGNAFQCTSSDERTATAASALGGAYTCPGTGSTSPQCPPPAEDAPIPTDDASPGDDAGTIPTSPDGAPPAEDSPPPGTSPDGAPPAEDGPPPKADAGTPAPGGDDAGTPGSQHPPGNGHGNPNPPGHSCECDAGAQGDGGTPPSTTPPDGNPPGGGSSGGQPPSSGDGGEGPPPPYDCESEEGLVSCTQPPTCEEGTHASACGACVPDGTTEDCVPPSDGGCWVTGGGFIDPATGQDTFGGNAMPMKSGTIRGQWENIDHGSGMNVHGQPTYLYCRQVNEPGPGADNGPQHDFTMNQAYFGGPATVSGAAGYWFDVVVDDHGEGKGAKSGGPDLYHITVRSLGGPNQSGAILYDGQGTLDGGNIQLHPPNNGHPFTASTLPSWVVLQP